MEVWDKGDETFVNIFWDPTYSAPPAKWAWMGAGEYGSG